MSATLPSREPAPGRFRALPPALLSGLRPPRRIPPALGRLGSLEVRLAAGPGEVRRAQRLRYRVFVEEMGAASSRLGTLSRRETDPYDALCDHLLVLDHAAPDERGRPAIVGTYRLLRQERAEAGAGFCTALEYDLAPLLGRHPGRRFLELGRSCVLGPYRGRRTIELLWAGLWAYVRTHGIDAMIGCASFPGTDPEPLAVPLAYLHHHAPSPAEWRVSARPGRHVAMDRLSPEAIDGRAALAALPPLVKAYLRVGATFGDGAVVDPAFNTTDVFVVMPVAAIAGRYLAHFAPAANRYAA